MEPYNWWKDPKNAEKVKRLSWWDHSENRSTIEVPVAVINDGKYWVVSTIDDDKWLGEYLYACAQGDSKEEAISRLFGLIRFIARHQHKSVLSYQRWVPFIKGPWGKTGGNWFTVFGLHVYFRYGKKMKGGCYVPFTKLNISISSYWTIYSEFKKRKTIKE